MRHDFNQIIERRGTNCGKWEFMAIQNRNTTQDTLPFWVADMDLPCPESVIEALHNRVDKKIFGGHTAFLGSRYGLTLSRKCYRSSTQ